MKTSLESLVTQTFTGKTFLASEFHDAGDIVYDIYDQEVCPIDEFIGKKITKAEVIHFSEGDVGLAFTFDECDDRIFFHVNCNITIQD